MICIYDALQVLIGRKTAMDNAIPDLILGAFSAAHHARRAQNQIEKQISMDTPPATTHDIAKGRLQRTKAYLIGLLPFLAAVAVSLEEARIAASVGSAERKRYQDQIDALTANEFELHGLIGDVDSGTAAADLADDALPGGAPVIPPFVPGEEVPPLVVETPTDPPTGDLSDGPGASAGNIPSADGTGPPTA